MDIEDLIDDYNNGNESEWMNYFGDELDVFFKYAHRRGFFDKLDILDIYDCNVTSVKSGFFALILLSIIIFIFKIYI